MAGTGVAFLLEYLDDTLRTPKDVSQALGLSTLAAIGQLSNGGPSLVLEAESHSPVAESFRVLATNIRYFSLDQPLRTLLVTSPHPFEGKSTVVANLAVATARAGLATVAVDADLRRPILHKLFGLDASSGLSESILAGSANGRLQSTDVEGLLSLTSGELPPNPTELLGSRHMQGVLQGLTSEADIVLLDSSPILPAADATVLARSVDGVLLVLYAGRTGREAARQAVERLQRVEANLLGVVLTGVPIPAGNYYKPTSDRSVEPQRHWRWPLTAVSQRIKRNG
jgi:non-specific protein-tyrosine kinase